MEENKKIEWKAKFDSYERANTMPLDRAKIEALRRIAEQLEDLNGNLENVIDELANKDVLPR